MKDYFSIIKKNPLFYGIDDEGLERLLLCIEAEKARVKKGAFVLLAGERPQHIGLVLTGRLHIFREDYEGNRSMLAALTEGEIFAEALCCAGVSESPVSVMADADSLVVLMSFSRLLHTCPQSCSFHGKLIENMLKLTAQKNLEMQSKMEIISKKTVRARVLHYLESLLPQTLAQEREVTVPFNREGMADFLGVERSALSHELMKMREEGLIEYRKNRFVLKSAVF